ncbi:hypothetical protein IWX49DRAFT_344885 [Phyllosticta citricarpa]|uniref:BZIP transcription factor n=2 Tax=Phyllosticta TaxID=121621 RepID=A0ABR1MTE9_9PEZI
MTAPAPNSEAAPTSTMPQAAHDPASSSAIVDDEYVSPASSSSSINETAQQNNMPRPKLGSRKSSGTIIIPRDSPQVELGEEEEEYDENDARTMSPRRTSEEIEKISQEAREALIQQAKALQASLLSIVDRVESVRCEHEKLEGGNRFLQSYIGELMQTSKLTAAGAAKPKGTKGRPLK